MNSRPDPAADAARQALEAQERRDRAGGDRPADPKQLDAEAAARRMLHQRVDRDFVYHAPTTTAAVSYTELRDKARDLAHRMVALVPPGRELSTALTKLEEAVMWANAGIARPPL